MEELLRKEKGGSQQNIVKSEQGTQLAFFLLLWVTCNAGNGKKGSPSSSSKGTYTFSGFCYSVEKE